MASPSAPRVPADMAKQIVNPFAYGEWKDLQRTFATLRRDNPVALVEVEGYRPFWAITRHADILKISKDNARFLNAPRSVVLGPLANSSLVQQVTGGSPHLVRSLVTLDAPEHMAYRKLTQSWFMPPNLKRIEDDIRLLAKAAVDRMLASGGRCDFARDVAAEYPLHVIMKILGVPAQDEPLMLALTQQMFGSEDPDLNRSRMVVKSAEEITATVIKVVGDFEHYFEALAAQRRAEPRDDVASVIANGTIDGKPIDPRMAAGYYIIVAAAGHDTTSASTSGAMWALAEDPSEFARVKANPDLLPGLIEEAIRWTTPVQHFMRTAGEDVEIGGQVIEKDDSLMLCYVSGNYDETVFEEPNRFRSDREPNRHVAFGSGAHMCLGLHMARLEMRILFEELLKRIAHVELAGEPKRSNSTFVSGPKTLPLRFVAA
ncbi:cytochrome P450 [Bradyrhizobium prioriisuperbiae]|uniref:cytochrome P450 n=1 Tax=Bradyrhizobium prioriisuperbiae TaxID=2854389 RepID=UPI0028E1F785|nr:cytochrome P450 [Bradyrhizobium prioritasuperba]